MLHVKAIYWAYIDNIRITAHEASDDSIVRCQECFLYTYTGVGLSALPVSTTWAIQSLLHVERVTEQAPRFFVCINTFINPL